MHRLWLLCRRSYRWHKAGGCSPPLAMQVMNQFGYFMSVELNHVPREQNQRADALANRALGPKTG